MEAEENFISKRVTYCNNVSWMILKLAGKTFSENWDTFGNCHPRYTQEFHGQFTLETASSFSLAKPAYTLLKHLFICKCARFTCLLLPVFVCCRLVSDLYPPDLSWVRKRFSTLVRYMEGLNSFSRTPKTRLYKYSSVRATVSMTLSFMNVERLNKLQNIVLLRSKNRARELSGESNSSS